MKEEKQEHEIEIKEKNNKTIGMVSLVLGVVSFLFYWNEFLGGIMEIAAIFLGIFGISKKKGKNMAIAGLICGIIALLLTMSFVQPEGDLIENISTNSSELTETAEEREARIAKEKEEQEKIETEFKDSCESFGFKEIARNPDNFKGKRVKLTGEIIQVSEGWSNSVDIRMNITKNEYGWYEDTIYCTYKYAEGESKILEKDIVTIYGTCEGDYTYTSILGASVTLPKVSIKYIVINE